MLLCVTFSFVLLCISNVVNTIKVSSDEGVIAETLYGSIQGTTTVATNQKVIYSFKSIPFAKPPKRFEAPRPLDVLEDSWHGVIRDGTKNPPACAQYLTNLSPASENCLYLNVYTPIKPGKSNVKLPVMVFIYGGINIFGDTVIYGPNRLMGHQDIVLVVIQYRLGALGFLSTGDDIVPGNNGLKDQREALRWVQRNIGAFNGDETQVTLFGESAGASAAISQMLSPTSEAGLFHKVIAQSGTPLAVWAHDDNPRASAEAFARSVKCTEWTNTGEMVTCLRELDWRILAQASLQNFISASSNLTVDFGALALVVEHEHDGAFMPRNPLEILKEGSYPNIPVILGANQHEGSAVLGGAWSRNLGPSGDLENPNFVRHELVPILLNALKLGDEGLGTPMSQSLADYYIPPHAQKDNFTEITPALVNMLSAFFFKAPVLLTADYLSQHSDQIYVYSFEYEGSNSLWMILVDLLSIVTGAEKPPIKHGVMHADDLIYFWALPFVLTGKDRQFSEMVCEMWTNFAISSNPTPGSNWPTWSPYTTNEPNYFKLDFQPTLGKDYTKNWRTA